MLSRYSANEDLQILYVIYTLSRQNLPDDDGGLSKEYRRELIKALHRLRKENPDGLSEFIGPIYTIFYGYSRNVTNGVATIDSEVSFFTQVLHA